MPDESDGMKPLTTKIGSVVLASVIGGGLGFVGSWATTQQKVADQERRLSIVEGKAAYKEEMQGVLNAINASQSSVDRRLQTIEGVMMRPK